MTEEVMNAEKVKYLQNENAQLQAMVQSISGTMRSIEELMGSTDNSLGHQSFGSSIPPSASNRRHGVTARTFIARLFPRNFYTSIRKRTCV